MNPVAFEFAERKTEVDLYFGYLEKIDRDGSCLALVDGSGMQHVQFGREFRTILKANAVLLLYNLVESTVQKAIESIAEAVGREKASYEDASRNLRAIWSKAMVRRLRKATEETWTKELSTVVEECLRREVLELNAREVLKSNAGNIDADFVRKLADDFGFTLDARPAAKGGAELERIKRSRNDLAHGIEKFTQVGGRLTVADIQMMKEQVGCFLEDLIISVERYVAQRQFKVA
jgi:hypothetical protein